MAYSGLGLSAAFGVLALAAFAGCASVLDYDDIGFVDAGGAAATAEGGVGGGGEAGTGGQPDGGQAPDGPAECDGVDCGPQGSCEAPGGAPVCVCLAGFHPEGLSCVADPPPDPCLNVTCGAFAHCLSGSCACDDGYQGDPAAGCTKIPTTEDQVRADLVAIALAEQGSCEGVDDKDYMLGQPGYWCYDFVAWVYSQSSYPLPSPMSLPTHPADAVPASFLPEPGDLIKFNIQHYGMVRSVSANGSVIETVEGNVNSCVTARTVSLGELEYFGSLDSAFP